MKRTYVLPFIAIASVMFFASCGGDETNTSATGSESATTSSAFTPTAKNYTLVAGDASGIFRGVSFGMSVDDVKALETTWEPETDNGTDLWYELENDMMELDVQYRFNESGLYSVSIDVEVYKENGNYDEEEHTRFFNDFVTKVGAIAGEPTKTEESSVDWSAGDWSANVRDRNGINMRLTYYPE